MNDILWHARGPMLALANDAVRSAINRLLREHINPGISAYKLNDPFNLNSKKRLSARIRATPS
jgi:hypothetical protein